MGKVRKLLFESTYSRTAGIVVNSLIGGVLTNWLIADISVQGQGVRWTGIWQTQATLWLGLFLLVFVIYTHYLRKYETELFRWNDPDFLRAALRKQLVPALLKQME